MKLGFTLRLLIFCVLLLGFSLTNTIAHAQVLWAGGEDVDFPNGVGACVVTTGGTFRATYARESLEPCTDGQAAQSNPFAGGPVTSAWISGRVYVNYVCCGGSSNVGFLGLGKSGTNVALMVGETNSYQTALFIYNGGWTKLANEAGASLIDGLNKVDMQIINFGTTGTVNVYINGGGSPILTYTGNLTGGVLTNLDTAFISSQWAVGNNTETFTSEIIVSSTDTRSLTLATLVPSSAGDTNAWTGGYTNINPTAINDASNITDNNSGDQFECKVTVPAGSFAVEAVKIAARGSKGTTGLTSMSVGVKTNGTVNAPAAVGQGLSWGTTETMYNINPVTSTGWALSDLSTLQINLTSAP